MSGERPLSEVLHDILRDVQEIVRSEVRLATVEIRDEAKRALSSGMWIAAGLVAAVNAWIFLLWTAVYLLATWMSMWAATLAVAIAMVGFAGALVLGGLRRARRIQPVPERTIQSVKENLEWMKQPTK